MPPRSPFWCFTLNNPLPEDIDALRTSVTAQKPGVRAMVFQREIGEHGTPHLQGYFQLWDRQYRLGVKNMGDVFHRMHLEVRQGTHEQAYAYCTKEDTRVSGSAPYEFGQFLSIQGKRTDISEVITAIESCHDFRDVIRLGDSFVAGHMNWAEAVFESRRITPPEDMRIVEFRPWQQSIMDRLALPPDPRTIFWVVDERGGKGKSRLALHLYLFREGSLLFQNSKSADVALVCKKAGSPSLIMFDLARCEHEHINYSIIEHCKDGVILSGKYNSSIVCFSSRPHVLVFANAFPEPRKFSEDRVEIIFLE